MKKKIFDLLTVAMIAIMCFPLSACDGDDGNDEPGKEYSVVGTWQITEIPDNGKSDMKVGDIIVITADGKIYDKIDQLGTWKKGGQCTLTDSEAYPVPFTAKVLSLTENFMSVDITINTVTFNMKLKRVSSITNEDGSGDDDTIGVVPGDGSTSTTSNVDFTIPCLNWTWTKEQVKEYMSGETWTLQTESAYELMFDRKDGTKIYYSFGSGDHWNTHTGLESGRVVYKNTKVSDFQWLVNKTQQQYNVKMTTEENEGYHGADVTFNLDGTDVEIVMMRYPTGEIHMKWMLL